MTISPAPQLYSVSRFFTVEFEVYKSKKQRKQSEPGTSHSIAILKKAKVKRKPRPVPQPCPPRCAFGARERSSLATTRNPIQARAAKGGVEETHEVKLEKLAEQQQKRLYSELIKVREV